MRNYLVLSLILFGAIVTASGQTDYRSTSVPTKEEFYGFCIENSIMHHDVVWAQARHESGNFTSEMYKNKRNCLGLYDSRNKRYMSFDH